jgi:predicted phage terminase large subunit-like protein
VPKKFGVNQEFLIRRFPKLIMRDGECREWFILPRGEGKTTLLGKLGTLWVIVLNLLKRKEIRNEIGLEKLSFNPINYILLLGANESLPGKTLDVIKRQLTSNKKLLADFPEIFGEGEIWNNNTIITANRVKVETFGIQQGLRGTTYDEFRAELIIPDDIITDEEARSATICYNRWDTFSKSVEYLGPPDGSVKIICAATVLSNTDPVSTAKKTLGHTVHHRQAMIAWPVNMELWHKLKEIMLNHDAAYKQEFSEKFFEYWELPSYQFYLENKKAMDEGAVTSWPDYIPLYKLMFLYFKDKYSFYSEKQGTPVNEADKKFTNIQHWDKLEAGLVYYGACDPSLGKTEKSHPSAIIIGAYNPTTQKLYLVEANIEVRTASKLLNDLILLQNKYQCEVIIFESTNAYDYMREQFQNQAFQMGYHLPLIGFSPSIPKMVRINALEPYISGVNTQIYFHLRLVKLLNELDTWPVLQKEHDYDGLSALYLLWFVALNNYTYSNQVLFGNRLESSNIELPFTSNEVDVGFGQFDVDSLFYF